LRKTAAMKISVYGTTDIGKRREQNEDGFVIHDLDDGPLHPPSASSRSIGRRGVLLAVCDGMGGHNAGEVASSLALEALAEEMETLNETCPRPDLFRGAVDAVNQRVWKEASLHPRLAGMGTTLTAALICPERALLAHVGDSRAYFARRGGRLQQITKDQSIAGSLIATGKLTEEEAKKTPFRHVLLQAIGTSPRIEMALDGVALHEGDTILLCSDGLSGEVDREDIARHVVGDDLQAAADSLVALANERGGRDNITVVIARME
jgi:PPM family protein phosphatase